MALKTLNDLLYNRLSDIYDAEIQLKSTWPQMVDATKSEELRTIFQNESASVESEIMKLDDIFDQLGFKHDSIASKGMRGIIEETQEIIQEEGDPTVKDAALISVAQEIKHYEMAALGSVRSWAKDLDESQVASQLQDILNDDGSCDKKLTSVAEGGLLKEGINKQAPK